MKVFAGISPLGERLASMKSLEPLSVGQFMDRIKERRAHQPINFFVEEGDDGIIVRNKFQPNSKAQPLELVPEMPDADGIRALAEKRGIAWEDGFEERAAHWFASDERVDGEGDIIRQNWDFETFNKNSPMPFGHRWDEPPIGRHIKWQVVHRADADYQGPALYLLGIFMPPEMSQFADGIYRMVRSGFLPSVSVGFQPLEILDVKSDQERAELGLGPWGLVFNRSELLETSPVTVPANPGANQIAALQEAASKGKVSIHDMHCLMELSEEDEAEGWAKAIIDIARAVWPDQEFPIKETNMDLEELKEVPGLLRELVAAFNEFSSCVATMAADHQTALDELKSALKVGQEKGAEETDDEDNDNDGKSLENLRGSLSEAVSHVRALSGALKHNPLGGTSQ